MKIIMGTPDDTIDIDETVELSPLVRDILIKMCKDDIEPENSRFDEKDFAVGKTFQPKKSV